MNKETILQLLGMNKTGEVVNTEGYHPVMIEGNDIIGLEEHSKTPYLVKEARILPSMKAFIDYITAFKQPETVVFADAIGNKMEAVLDYHVVTTTASNAGSETTTTPSWTQHKVSFSLQYHDDFAHFKKLDKAWLQQDELVNALTDYRDSFHEPKPAAILEIVGNIEMVDNKELTSKINGGNLNTMFKHDKELKSKGATAPSAFIVNLPVFKGVNTLYQVPFRLMWKCDETTRNKLVFQINLIRPHAIIEAAFNDICADVQATGVALFGADVAKVSSPAPVTPPVTPPMPTHTSVGADVGSI